MLLFNVGKATLIKTVIKSILNYMMSTFKMLVNVCNMTDLMLGSLVGEHLLLLPITWPFPFGVIFASQKNMAGLVFVTLKMLMKLFLQSWVENDFKRGMPLHKATKKEIFTFKLLFCLFL